MIECPKCGNEGKGKFCSHCGTRLVDENVGNNESRLESTNDDNLIKFVSCSNCGNRVKDTDKFCDNCGAIIDRDEAPVEVMERINPVKSAVLSAIVPGIGQVYNNQFRKGITLFAIWLVGLLLILFFIGWFVVAIIWIYSIYDAYTCAHKLNEGLRLEDKLF